MTELSFGRALVPADWVVSASISLVGPADDLSAGLHKGKSTSVHPNVNLTVSPLARAGTTADEMREAQRASLARDLPRFKVVEAPLLERSDGTKVPCLAYSFEVAGGMMIRQVQLVIVVDGRAHFVTATAPEASFAKHWESLKEVLLSYEAGAPN